MPVLVPASSADLVDLGLHGFALSRFSGLWVGLKVVTDFADGFAALDLEQLLPDPVLPEVRVEGRRWHHTQIPTVNNTVSVQQEHDILVGRLEAARAYALANGLNRVTHGCEDAWPGLVAAGKSHADLLQALEWAGLGPDSLAHAGIRVLKIGMPYPLEPTAVRAFARGLEQILVIEEKRPFLELFVRDVLYGEPHHPPVTGKRATDGSMVVPAEGDLTADRLVEVLREQLASRLGSRPRRPRAPGRGTRIADAPVSLPVSVVAGRWAGRQRPPSARLLQRLPSQPLHGELAGRDRGRRGRLPLHRLPGGPPRRRRDPAADPDGRRGRALGRGGQVRAGRAHLPEPRRRDLCPLREFRDSSLRSRRSQHHVQAVVQRRHRHDGRPRRRRRHGGAGNDARARGARCPPHHRVRGRPHRHGRDARFAALSPVWPRSGSPRPRRRWRGNRGSPH